MKFVYPGTFDPPTVGHLDIIKRAKKICDVLYIAVAKAHHKQPFFSLEERKNMLEKLCSSIFNKNEFKVCVYDGLLVDFCRKEGINTIVRGLRDSTDLDYENRLSGINRLINPDIDTVYLQSKAEFSSISSSMLRETLKLGGNTKLIIPDILYEEILKKANKIQGN